MSAKIEVRNIIHRYPGNPILTPRQIPYESALVYNAGVVKFGGRYVMAFRNDYGLCEADFANGYPSRSMQIRIGLAESSDGVHWTVNSKADILAELRSPEVLRLYDPRLTVIEGRCYLCFAMDTRHGLRGGIAVTDDLEHFEVLSISVPDNRNMVLFPEKIGGKFVRLERPFPVYSRGGGDRFDMWISDSPDARYWGNSDLLLAVEDLPFANDKIGPGAPPVRTPKGWLAVIHAVDLDRTRGKNGWEPKWQKRYFAGLMLLDPENPRRVIGLCREPLLLPEAEYEVSGGIRNHVIFPGGMILEDSGEVKIYYGAADAVECLATADVGDLLALCKPFTP